MTAKRLSSAITLLAGILFLGLGIWAFSAPGSFYDQIAHFPPYNRHFLHDAGAFQIGIGAALLASLRWRDAMLVALMGAAAGAGVHALSHIIDHDLGGKDTDAPLLVLLAVLLAAGALARWTALEREP
jgi:hypothetical protein